MLTFLLGAAAGSLLTLVLLACLSVSGRESISEQIYESYWRGWHAGRAQLKLNPDVYLDKFQKEN